ncbi:MAG: quinone-dependent dihydroorotate dehydrogenase [Ferruginibacter sp.]
MYKILRSFLFLFDAEKVHYFSMNVLKFLCSFAFLKKIITKKYSAVPADVINEFGLSFKNPVGLAAGFDKNAKYLNELEALGFGFVEIGTVTPLPQAGNHRPRLFRLPKDKALINRMGFNNDGLEKVVHRLKLWKIRNDGLRDRNYERNNPAPETKDLKLIIGGNIGKNKLTPNEDAWLDYEKCFIALHNYVDYFVVNVSSPNTPGLRALQESDSLRKILTNLQSRNAQFLTQKPILLKIAPDLLQDELDEVIALALEIKLDGLVVANTTIKRTQLLTPLKELENIGAGGLSGEPLKNRSTEMVKYISEKTNGQILIIASGGIFTAADAKEKLNAGAILIQVWTGFIYKGPSIVKDINAGL